MRCNYRKYVIIILYRKIFLRQKYFDKLVNFIITKITYYTIYIYRARVISFPMQHYRISDVKECVFLKYDKLNK